MDEPLTPPPFGQSASSIDVTTTSSTSLPASRPSFLARSISSPQVPLSPNPRLGRGHRTIHGHSGTPHVPIPSRESGERDQWTLFGQLMSDERSGSALRSASLRRGPSQAFSNASPERLRLSIPEIEERTDDYPDIPDVLHSPTSVSSPIRPTPVRRRTYFDPDRPDNAPAGDISSIEESSDDESDTETLASEQPPADPSPKKSFISLFTIPEIPLLYKNVLKCSVAYLLASLFTFIPALSLLIHDLTPWMDDKERKASASAHMVATVAVYFNPAKTLGGMVEADAFCFIGLVYSVIISLLSLLMFRGVRHLAENPHPHYNENVVVGLVHTGIILWIGLSMSAIAFMKVYLNKPSFNTACSMTVIIMFVVLIREASPSKLVQTVLIAVIGAATSNLVNGLLWPTSATKNLQTNMVKTLDSFRVLLEILTSSFILEDSDAPDTKTRHKLSEEKLKRAVEAHQSSFTSLKKNLDEAKSEWYVIGGGGAPAVDGSSRMHSTRQSYVAGSSRRHTHHITNDHGGIWDRLWDSHKKGEERTSRKAYEDAVDSLNRLAQHLNGLRSGNRLLQQITNEVNFATTHDANAAVDALGELVEELSPPLKSLSTTCTNSLKVMKEAQTSAGNSSLNSAAGILSDSNITSQAFEDLVSDISRTLVRFDSTSNHALLRMYRRSGQMGNADGNHERPEEGDDVFVVYYFIFTLQEFARELVSLVDAMERIYVNEQIRRARGSWLTKIFVYAPRKVFVELPKQLWGWLTSAEGIRKHGSVRRAATNLRRRITLHRSISNTFTDRMNRQARPKPFFPKVKPHAPDTIQTPYKGLPWSGRVKARIWAFGEALRGRNVKYAFKTGICTAILAAPGLFDVTRPFFLEYYGDWALISYFIVLSPTIGATNNLSLHRILGTIIGASVAAAIFSLCPDSPILLAIFGFFFSIPCFYYIVATPKYVSAGRFVLLTYNLTCLYCYNTRELERSPVLVAWRRMVSVIGGVLWAALVSRVWWPAEARRELGVSLSEFCLNIGWLYTRLVASNSYSPEYHDEGNSSDQEDEPDERTALIRKPKNKSKALMKNNNSVEEFMAMELHLQVKLIELQGLLAQTEHEPRLKGPFPIARYRTILASLQTILDRLHSMRCVTTKEEWYTSVRKDFIMPVNKQRREMVGNIILAFSLMASSFRTKAPLPPYLPPAEKSRQALVDAIKQLDVVRTRDIAGSRQLLYFAYALTMKGVTMELDSLGRLLQDIFGVIGGDVNGFEELFIIEMDIERNGGVERGE
ncbi:hypothetical protein DL96DRAFT_1711406 [Flagelloscypha sp. PMI_526]|nr:hypothetical protein DL96DRAFT_1711406 [Flagelloscypha sp. PMI_526]